MLNKIEIVIENKVSVSASLLYIDGHVTHFRCIKANLAIIIFSPSDTRHYQHYFHTDTVTNYRYISLPAIIKTIFRNVGHFFCLLLACEGIRPHIAKRC